MVLRVCLLLALLTGVAGPAPVTIDVDAREVSRRLIKARLTLPAKPGKTVIKYPKWIPGEHAPSGPIGNVAKVAFSVGGKALTWSRDPVELFNFIVDVPPGATTITADLEFVLPESGVFSGGGSASDRLGVLSWNHYLLYPDGKTTDELRYRASVTVPKGWKVATALVKAKSGYRTEFQETLAVRARRHARRRRSRVASPR